ncbi:MAG: hypothetical protein U1D30_18710 [Planctomycetota bacterium]
MGPLSMVCAGLLAVSLAGTLADAKSKSNEPATAEAAARVLDLRKFPVMDGAKISGHRSLGMLTYDAKGTPKQAFEFQRKELTKLGFKEMPGGYSDENNNSGHFTKDKFVIAVSSTPSYNEPNQAGWSSVSIFNRGNVELGKLPVPPGVKPFYPSLDDASYTTTASVADTAAACRKLLLAAGWEPYGQAGGQPEMSMQYFKRHAIKLQSWVSTTPADGGKTLIRYSTDLMTADLPAPPDATDPRYDDMNKKLDMDEPIAKTDAILAFYRERLPKMGWKPTTDHPIVDADKKSQFLIFRNANKELLELDMEQYTDIVRVRLKHQTEEELAEEERRAKEFAEKKRQEKMERERKIKVAIALPNQARKIEKPEAHRMEFALPSGTGRSTLEAFRGQFRSDGWKEQTGAMAEKNAGNVDFAKGNYSIRFSYFDVGFGDAEFTVSASTNVELDATTVKGNTKTAKDSAKSPKASKKPSGIPGLPDLPAGVEIPAEARDLLKKAQEEIDAVDP